MKKYAKDRVAILLRDRDRLPALLRPAHRLATGVPRPGARPKGGTPLRHFAKDVGLMGLGMAAAAVGVHLAAAALPLSVVGIPLTFIGMLGATGRARRIVVGHVHEASHGVAATYYSKRGMSRRRARRIAEAILDFGTAITLTTNGQEYRRDHGHHHDPRRLGTLADPDGALLKSWSLWPDEAEKVVRRLLLLAFSPRWHARFFAERLASNLLRGRPSRRLLGAAALALMAGSAFVLSFPVWLAAVFLPLGPGYQIATLLQLATIHPYGFATPADTLEAHAERTWTRIPYAPMPEEGSGVAAWGRWAIRALGHAMARLAVLDDTMVAHDYHHLAWPIGEPFEDWWNTAIYWVDSYVAGRLPEGAESRVLWGLPQALQRQQEQFDKLRARP
ncbi:MAG TPA: fatty acid desaturase [Allosphingosinicella sp.]|nr:fatty acid desaturase [Allosphingosinicella sp.]